VQPEQIADIIVDALRPLVARLAALEGRAAADPTTETMGRLRERCAVLETRAPVPGPAGQDGLNGKDGTDGLGFGDLVVDYDGERTFTLKAVRDLQTKELGRFKLPIPIYRDTWKSVEVAYESGDIVTHDSSGWICKKDTTTQPGTAAGAGFWKLFVKRGGK
jgi:integrin beta 3